MQTASAIPPALPPSVEEAYRRKCLQLKQRTNEVEEANDASRLRLMRLKRQVEKLRVERSYLLEQLAKRTSTNVEDSEGSPSPPPTVRSNQPHPLDNQRHLDSDADMTLRNVQPKEKPLRTKRGHRKPSLLANLEGGSAPGATFINQNVQTLSPSSDAFSHTHAEGSQKEAAGSKANGVGKPKKPSTAFELYCSDTRPTLAKGDGNVEEELAKGWKDLPEKEKEEYQARYDKAMSQYQKDKDAYAQKATAETKAEAPAESQAEDTPARDEDVEMGEDTEQETPAVEKEDE